MGKIKQQKQKGTISREKYIERRHHIIDSVMLAIAAIIVLVVSLCRIGDNYSIRIWGDEFGYWQSAALITGKDWYEVAATNLYYGFGYGLLLAPIMAVFAYDSVVMFHAALVLEAVMLASCVYAAYLVLGFLAEDIKGFLRVLIAVVAVLYPSNIVFVNMTLAEILLVTLVWWYSYLVLCFVYYKKISHALIMTIISVYMYSVHQRTIMVMVLNLLLIIWVYRKQVKSAKFFWTVGVFLLSLILVIVLKDMYVDSLYAANIETVLYTGNNIAGQTSKIAQIMTTLSGFVKFIYSCIGKFYYFTISTCFLGFFGLIFWVVQGVECLKEKKMDDRFLGLSVICLNFLASFGINAIYMSDGYGDRIDRLFYGRYMEHNFGLMIVIGVVALYYGVSKVQVMWVMIASSMSSWMVGGLIENKSPNSHIWWNCTALADLITDKYSYVHEEGIYLGLIRAALVCSVLVAVFALKGKVCRVFQCIALSGLMALWIYVGIWGVNENVLPWSNEVFTQQEEILRQIEEDEFVIFDAYMGAFFQFLRPDYAIHVVSEPEQIEEMEEEMYIVTYKYSEFANYVRENGNIIFEKGRYILWKNKVQE